MAKRTNISKPMVESNVAVMDTGTADTLSESEQALLNEMIAEQAAAAADEQENDDNESDGENESESKPETLAEQLARNTAEKIAAIEKQRAELESQHAAVLANVTSDAVRLVAVDLLNSDSFVLPDEIKLETGTTIGLALEYNVDSKSWSMAVDAVVKLPKIRTVASGSESVSYTHLTLPTILRV